MLDKESYAKLLTVILEQVDTKYPSNTGGDKLTNRIAKIAAEVSVIALQEYEKLNQ